MTSLDPENIRRAQAEQRIAMQASNEGSGAMWFLVVVVFAAIIGGIIVYGGDGATATDASGLGAASEAAPLAAEEAPAATVTE